MFDKNYVIDADGSIRETEDLREVIDCMNDDARRVVAEDAVPPDAKVSTVFVSHDLSLGFEGKPVLFETMVFGGPLSGKSERYCTKQEAQEGHKRWVSQAWAALKTGVA